MNKNVGNHGGVIRGAVTQLGTKKNAPKRQKLSLRSQKSRDDLQVQQGNLTQPNAQH